MKNPFDQARQAFDLKSADEKALEAFTPKPYHVRTLFMARAAALVSFVLSIASIATSYAAAEQVFMFTWLAISVLVVIEVGKHASVSKVFDTYLPDQQLDVFPCLFALLFIGLSAGSAFYGGNQLPNFADRFTGGPTLLNTDSIKNHYQDQVKAAELEAENFRQSGLWRGRLSNRDRQQYALKTSEVNDARDRMNEALAAAAKSNQDTLSSHQASNQSLGVSLGWLNLMFEGIIIFCIGFQRHRLWQHAKQLLAEKNKTQPSSPAPSFQSVSGQPGQAPPTNQRRIGFFNDRPEEPKAPTIHDTTIPHDNRGTGFRSCKHCGNQFKPNANKHVYCVPACRMAANGFELKGKKSP